MTTVADAKRELAQIAERQAQLQMIVDAAPKSLLANDDCISIGARMIYDEVDYAPTADAYADALDTLLRLRHQPGTEAATSIARQFLVVIKDGAADVDYYTNGECKLERISPCFATESDAKAAIDTIGADRILRMFHTLHGVA